MSVRRILLTTDSVGGVWTYAVDLAAGLAGIGIETVLVTMGPPPDAAQRAAVDGLAGVTLVESDAELDWLADDADAITAAAQDIAELARAHGVDLIHLNTPALAAGGEFEVPVVAAAHSCLASWWGAVKSGPLPASFAWRDALTRQGLLAADAVVAPSQAFAALTQQVHRLPFMPRVVHNGRAPLTLPARTRQDHAFTAGRLWDAGKDLATLDRAAAAGAPIRAAGPLRGPNGETIVLDHVACLGTLEPAALAAELAGRPIFVSAALYEPFGLAVLEAAQAGCALVLADIPTFRELWGEAALFVTPRDADAFADAVARLIADPAERDRREAGAREAAARYTVAAMRDGMAAIYASVARGTSRRSARAAA